MGLELPRYLLLASGYRFQRELDLFKTVPQGANVCFIRNASQLPFQGVQPMAESLDFRLQVPQMFQPIIG
jgi:hypothetical protein